MVRFGRGFPMPTWWRQRAPLALTATPVVTIAGVDVGDKIRTGEIFQFPTFTWRRNQRAVLTFDIELDPAKRAEVIWYDKSGLIPIIGAFIDRREPIDVPFGAPFCSRVEALDFTQCYDWCYWTKNYLVDKTRKEVLQDLIAEKLGPNYSITLDPSQADGPTYTAPFGWTDAKVSQVIKELVGADSIDRITPGKVLKVFVAGSEAAPVSIDADNCANLKWADSTQTPANTVIGVFGANVTDATHVNQQWLTDGVATSFAINEDNIPGSRETLPNLATVDGTDYPIWPVGMAPGGDGIEWDPDTNNGTLNFIGTATALVAGVGDLISLSYFPRLPYRIEKSSGAPVPIETLVPHPDIWQWAQANFAVEQDLAQLDQDDARVFDLDTLEDGLFPGQLLPIDVPEKQAEDVEAIITAVSGVAYAANPTVDPSDLYWDYHVTAEEAAALQPDAITDLRRQMALR